MPTTFTAIDELFRDGLANNTARKQTFVEKVKDLDSGLSDKTREVFDLVQERTNLVFHGGLCGPGFSDDKELAAGVERIIEIDRRLSELIK